MRVIWRAWRFSAATPTAGRASRSRLVNLAADVCSPAPDAGFCEEQVVVRCYEVEDTCQNTLTVTQAIRFTLVTNMPMITAVETGGYHGCQSLGWRPEALVEFMHATNATSDVLSAAMASEVLTTNDCTITLLREYKITNCCGDFDRREVLHWWTIEADAVSVPDLGTLQLGCIGSTDAIPPVDVTLFATSVCSVVAIWQIGPDAITGTDCVATNIRLFRVTNRCGLTNTVAQQVVYTIDDGIAPEITATETGRHHGCQDPGFSPAAFVSFVGATNATSDVTNAAVMTQIRTTNDCEVTLLRVYRVSDCCGHFDRREVTHRYTQRPTSTTVPSVGDLVLGCVPSTNELPGVLTALESAAGNCAVGTIRFVSNSLPVAVGTCSQQMVRVYDITAACDDTAISHHPDDQLAECFGAGDHGGGDLAALGVSGGGFCAADVPGVYRGDECDGRCGGRGDRDGTPGGGGL